jgi:ClpP class serine protease
MANRLLRLTERLYNVPHLITSSSFDTILSYLELRNAALSVTTIPVKQKEKDVEAESFSGVGVLNVSGALTYKPVMGMCGEVDGASYTGMQEAVEQMIGEGCHTIVMQFSSGGGEASHAFEYCNYLREACDEAGVKLISYIDEMAASAAYAYACIADEVIINPSASAGSIGCVVALMDTSKAYENAGLKRIFITSGANKVPFDAQGAFKQEFLNEIQADVDRLNMQFAAHVSSHTGLSVEEIMSFQAGMFNADEALEKGLVNKVMNGKQFAAYIADKNKNKGGM